MLIRDATKLLEIYYNKFLDGLDTNVGVGSSVNIQGIKTKNMCCSAIYHNKDFLLFDEPTSSLDKDIASIIPLI